MNWKKLCGIILFPVVLALKVYVFVSFAALLLVFSPFLVERITNRPIPFNEPLWEQGIDRHRMVDTIEDMIIGLSEREVIELLGEPSGLLNRGWHYVPRGLDYDLFHEPHAIWGFRRPILVIHFDEDMIAYSTSIAKK